MLAYSFNVFNPDLLSVLLYIQLLGNSYSPGTVKNCISGGKTFLEDRGYDVTVFSSRIVRNMLTGIEKLSNHIPKSAPVLGIKVVKQVCDVLRLLSIEGKIAADVLLFGTVTFLRQSNFVFTSTGCIQHIVKRKDLIFEGNTMWVNVPSTKTLSQSQSVSIPVHRIPGSTYCPVNACIEAMRLVPSSPDNPIFLCPRTFSALTAFQVTRLLRVALFILQHEDAGRATIHSTRHTGAAGCAAAGVDEDDVRKHGTWKTGASRVYAPKRLYTKSSHTLSTLLK